MKKFVSVLIILQIILCNFSVLAASSDVEVFEKEKYIVLEQLGIVSDVNSDHNQGVTKEQVIAQTLALMNISAGTDVEQPVFTDVTVADVYYNQIMTAYKLGIIAPDNHGKLNAKSVVTTSEAISMIIKAMNYSKFDDPTARRVLSRELSRDVNTAEILDYGAWLNILYNALFIEIDTVYTTGLQYIGGKSTLIEICHNVFHDTGIVEKTWYGGIDGAATEKNVLVIDGNEYHTLNRNDAELLGKSVELYFKNENGTKKLLCAIPINNTTVSFYSFDVKKFSENTINVKLRNEEKVKKYKIDGNSTMLCNYQLVSESNYNAKLTAPYSKITMTDNNSDGTYDLVLVDEYTVFETAYVELETQTLIDKAGTTLEYGKYADCVIKDMSGKLLTDIDLKSDSILIINNPGDFEKTLFIKIVDYSVTEKISELKINTREMTLESGEEFYLLNIASLDITRLDFSTYFKFYADNDGNIVYFKEYADIADLGQLMFLAGTAMNGPWSARVMLYGQAEGLKIYDLADEVRVRTPDGVTEDKSPEATKALIESYIGDVGQMVIVDFDENNNVKKILFAGDKNNQHLLFHEIDYTGFNPQYNTQVRWMGYQNQYSWSFNNVYQTRADTKIFVIPYSEEYKFKDEWYSVTTRDAFQNDTTYYTDKVVIKCYAINKDSFIADYIMWGCTDDNVVLSETTDCLGIVTEVYSEINPKDEKAYQKLNILLHDGAERSFYVETKGNIEDKNGRIVSAGDIVRVIDRGTGFAKKNDLILFYSQNSDTVYYYSQYDKGAGGNDMGFRYYGLRVGKADVLKKEEGFLLCNMMQEAGAYYKEIIDINQAKVLKFDTKLKTCRNVPVETLKDNDEIMMIMASTLGRIIIIYE